MAGLFRRRVPALPWDGAGRVVTIWGPTGSPGRSTLAAALAGALAPLGRIVVVDADRTRGALGPLLGVTDGGNIVSAATFPAPPGRAGRATCTGIAPVSPSSAARPARHTRSHSIPPT